MHPEHSRLQAVFNAAVGRTDAAEREAFLLESCAGDPEFLAKLRGLLGAHDEAETFLHRKGAADPEAGMSRSTVAMPREVLGTMIGRYKLLQEIGEGGFGIVYLADQKEPVKRRVALKVLKPGMDTREVVARFEAERQALALMDHPNIAQVYDGGATESGRPYFVMELVKGTPLTQYCDDHRLSTRQRLELFLEVLAAVQHAHQKGIIHRDLKPSNILVSPHDGVPVIKVIDFGIAKAISLELTERTLFTGFGQMIGTPQYMSPEQAETNALDVDTRSDVYSLGVVLYELLTGRTPLDAVHLRDAAHAEIQRLIREEEPPKPSTRISTLGDALPDIARQHGAEPLKLAKLVRGDLDWIVMKALEKDRTRRYETANAFAADVRRHLEDQPVLAHAPGAAYLFGKFVRRHKIGFAAGTAVALTLVFGIIGTSWGFVRAKANADAERTAKEQVKIEAAINEAVNEFITNDLFGAASPDQEPDRDLKVRTVLDRAVARMGNRFASQPLVEASILLTLGTTYAALGEYEKARELVERSLQLRTQLLGPEHPGTLEAKGAVGACYFRTGRRDDEALKIMEEVLTLRRKVLGPEHPDTLGAMHNLATSYDEVGRREEGLKMRGEVLTLRRKVNGPEHPDTLDAMSNLAISSHQAGRRDEALKMREEVLMLFRKVLGPGHPDTLGAMGHLAASYYEAGRRDDSLKMREDVLPLLRKILGPEHTDTLGAMNNLAASYHEAGRPDEALKIMQEVLMLFRKMGGPEHPDTLMAMINLALFYHDAGRRDEALRMREEALMLRRKVLGPEHPDTLLAMNHLAASYQDAGRRDEALKLKEEVLTFRRRVLGPEHPDTLGAMNSLAGSYAAAGRSNEALKLWEEVLTLRRKVSGPEHADALGAMTILASSYDEAGRRDEALKLSEEVLALRRKVSGPEHPETLGAMHNLARLYPGAGRRDEALKLQEEVLTLRRKVNGPDHPDTLKAMGNLAGSWYEAGRRDEALKLREEVLMLRRKVLGPEHPETLGAINDLALSYHGSGRQEEALTLWEEVLTLRRKMLGPEHPDTLGAMSNLALSYHGSGRPEEALPLQEEVLTLLRKVSGPEHPDTLSAMNNLAASYHESGRRDEALKMREGVLMLRRKVSGPEHPDALMAMNNLAASYHDAGRRDEALKMMEEVLVFRRKVSGPEHPDTLMAMNNLAASYFESGRRDEALKLQEEVLTLRRKVLGPEHPDTLRALHNLARFYLRAGLFDAAKVSFLEAIKLDRTRVLSLQPAPILAGIGELMQLEESLVAGLKAEGGKPKRARHESALNEIHRRLPSGPPPGPAELRAFAESNRGKLPTILEKAVIQTITIPKVNPERGSDAASQRLLAEAIRSQVADGGNFGDLARVHSADSAAAAGGRREITRTGLKKQLSDAAFALKPGEVSPLIDDGTHFYLIRLIERKPVDPSAIDLDDEAVQSAIAALMAEERAEAWKESYFRQCVEKARAPK